MNKPSKESLELFNQDIALILSKERLRGYENNLEKHDENLALAMEVGKRISILEIYLRNKLDYCLKQMIGEEWIKSEKSLSLITLKSHKSIDELTPPQILSTLMLGEVVELIEIYNIKHYMFDLRNMGFKKYCWNNRNFGVINGRKIVFSNIDKNTIVLSLIRTIRNRAFHWENLLKTTIRDNGLIFPRITTIYPKKPPKQNQTRIGIMPEMILCFLDDLINTIGNEVINKNTRKTLGI